MLGGLPVPLSPMLHEEKSESEVISRDEITEIRIGFKQRDVRGWWYFIEDVNDFMKHNMGSWHN